MLSYAEVHFRPGFIPSLIFMKWPEIVCDAPRRVDPGRPIPVFIIIKDAHRYPIRIEMVAIHMIYENGIEHIAQFPYGGITVNEPVWWDSINIVPEYRGVVNIFMNILVRRGKKLFRIGADNYSGTSHSPLTVYVAKSPLPGEQGWYHGDIHCHTFYTTDQIEFGAPIEVMAFAAYCMGLHWIASTDHSYDLDDKCDDYFSDDPQLTKWQMMRKQAALLTPTVTIIPGEEVTCRTSSGKNCHMLALNAERFIKGSGDSGEHGFKTATERSVGEAVRECIEWNGIACAAHPMEKIPFLERIILDRSEWTQADIESPGLTALQIHNGLCDSGFREGMKEWIRLLLLGRRIYAFGGSDAHGDMNRRRHIIIPFLIIGEDVSHTFGAVRTIVQASSQSLEDIIDGLKAGRAQVTEGPFIALEISCNGSVAHPGGTVTGTEGTVQAVFKSSPEFGAIKSGRIIAGTAGESDERILAHLDNPSSGLEKYIEKHEHLNGVSYIRADCETVSGKCCFTNPIWVEKRSG